MPASHQTSTVAVDGNLGLTASLRQSGRVWLGVTLLAAATSVAYLPSLHGGFVLDDTIYLTESPLVKAPDGLYRFWCTSEPIDYYPVSNTTLWLEWRLWGMNPTGYRITNLLLHIAAALLIWVILGKLSIPGAYLAAVLYAVHPVNVESVAWIAQRKGLLAMVFFLLSLLCYLLAEERRETDGPETNGWRAILNAGHWFWLSLLAFLLAMLSKGSVAFLPAVLLLLVWWRRGRVSAEDFVRTAPFFFVAIALTIIHAYFQKRGLVGEAGAASLDQRLAVAGAVVWFYLSKALWPFELIFVYPRWNVQTGLVIWWLPLAAAAALAIVLAWRRNTAWGRPLLLAWGYFCLALVPVMGLAEVGYIRHSWVADHYQYPAIVAVAALAAAGWSKWHRESEGAARRATTAVAVVVVLLLTFLSWRQCHFYASATTLYQATLQKNPNTWLIHNELGIELDEGGHPLEAIACYEQALGINPNYVDAHINLGVALRETGRMGEAIEQFEQALQIDPRSAKAHNDLGSALLETHQNDEALRHVEEAVRLMPSHPQIHRSLGIVFVAVDRLSEAVEQFQQAVRFDPTYAEAYNDLGLALVKLDKFLEAIEAYRRAIGLRPDLEIAHANLGYALLKLNRPRDAIEQYRQAVRFNPDDADAQKNLASLLADSGQIAEAFEHLKQVLRLRPQWSAEVHCAMGIALNKAGRPREAIDEFEKALQANPSDVEACNNLAWVLSTTSAEQLRDPRRAVDLASKAVSLDPHRAGALNTLGIALYRSGKWEEAIQWLNRSTKAGGGSGFDWFFLAMAHERLGHDEEAHTCYRNAVAWMDQHAPRDAELRRFQRETEELIAGKSAANAKTENPTQ